MPNKNATRIHVSVNVEPLKVFWATHEVLTKNVCVCHLGQIWAGVQGNKTSVLLKRILIEDLDVCEHRWTRQPIKMIEVECLSKRIWMFVKRSTGAPPIKRFKG